MIGDLLARALRACLEMRAVADAPLPLLATQRARLTRYASLAAAPLVDAEFPSAIDPIVSYTDALLACADGPDLGLSAVAHRCLQELALAVPSLAPSLGWRGVHRLRVLRVAPSGAAGVRIDLMVPPENRAAFAFAAGQHVKVFHDVEGVQAARSYSVCVAPEVTRSTGVLAIGVRRLPGGLVSEKLHRIAVGDELLVSVPHGNLFSAGQGDAPTLLAAGGSGVTPLVAIAEDLLSRTASHVGLVIVDRDPQHAMLTAEIEALRRRFPDRFEVRWLWTRLPVAKRPDGAVLERAMATVLPRGVRPIDVHAFACGPGDLLAEIRSCLGEAGVPDTQVWLSAFDTASRSRTAPLGAR